jgi:hypothetical protein
VAAREEGILAKVDTYLNALVVESRLELDEVDETGTLDGFIRSSSE